MSNKKLRILIINDNQTDLEAFIDMVSNSLPGTDILTAKDGLQGIKIAKINEPDVIMIDVSMSKNEGLKISQIIKKEKDLQTTPMLFITDLESDRIFRQALLKAGADAFLFKPLDDTVLITQLKVMAKVKERNILIKNQNEILEKMVRKRTKDLQDEILERQKLEIELRKSEELFSSYIKKAPIGVFVTNALGKYTDANDRACLMSGYTKEELLDLSISDFLAPDHVEKGLIEFSKLLDKGNMSDEYRVRRKNKKEFWISLFGTKINENCILAFCIDISERKSSEEKLKQLSLNLKRATEELAIKNDGLSSRISQTIQVLSKIGEMKDLYTSGHQKRVGLLSVAIAQEMKLSDDVIKNISIGALLHDIGKISIPSDILNKPGKLTNLEYQIIQSHVENSYEIVKGIDFPKQVIEMIYQHHERLDGSGYPQRLKGDQIILESRILSVSDVVEAMSSHRPYRPALGMEAGLEEIIKNKETKYDSKVVDACVRVFKERGFNFPNQLIKPLSDS